MSKGIDIPSRLALAEHVYGMRLDRIDLSNQEVCEVNFQQCTYGEPMPMLLLANKIRLLARSYPNCRFRLFAGKNPFHTYADHIGYFRYMGWARGRDPGEAWGSSKYVPIEVFSISDFHRRANGGPVGALINSEADRLATVLAQSDKGALFDVLQYAIREIVRNAAEHSRGEKVTILAQYWPKKDKAEIVIIDDGVGIPQNIYDNEYVECKNSREALKFALLPGISGVSLSERSKQDSYWGNSGFGLYVTSRVCASSGSFRVISDQQGLTLRSNMQVEHDWKLKGTCVQMVLNLKSSEYLKESIPKIIEDGEKHRMQLIGSYPIQASAASKMLSSQYRKMIFGDR